MSAHNDSRPPVVATVLAILSVLGGGAFYWQAMRSPAAPRIAPEHIAGAVTQPVSAEKKKGTGTSPLDHRKSLAASPAVLKMATAPKVSPPDQKNQVEEGLKAIVSSFGSCYRDLQEKQPHAEGRGSVHLIIGDGGAVLKPTLQFDGTHDPHFQKCITHKMQGATMKGVSPKTTVFWPLRMHPDTGVVLRGP